MNIDLRPSRRRMIEQSPAEVGRVSSSGCATSDSRTTRSMSYSAASVCDAATCARHFAPILRNSEFLDVFDQERRPLSRFHFFAGGEFLFNVRLLKQLICGGADEADSKYRTIRGFVFYRPSWPHDLFR